jgi:glyoxylase-like metal-dependent hydrolase (beta-lactamase superfamily II)
MFTFHPRIGFSLAGFAMLAASPLWAQPIDPIVREGVTEKISEHVHVIPDASVPLVPNVGIIVGTRGTFVVDTGLGVRNGEAVLREAGKVGKNAELYLGTTHFHPEHDLGAMAFPAQTKMLRSTDQQKDIAEFGLQLAKTFSTRSPQIAERLKDADFRKADIVFEREQTVDLGGVRVRVMAMGANHTRGDTVFFVEPDGVLFSGDVVMRPQPSFASPYSTVRHWLESLAALEKLSPKRIVPSHGPMGDTSLIVGYREYLTTVQARAAALKKEGKTSDEAVAAVTGELVAKYRDGGRLGGAVRAAYNEAP